MTYHFGEQEKALIIFISLLLFPSLCLRYCAVLQIVNNGGVPKCFSI